MTTTFKSPQGLVVWLTNFDYEEKLFSRKNLYSHSRKSRALEYLAFWVESDPTFYSDGEYSKSYLNFIERKTQKMINLSDSGKSDQLKFWWGEYSSRHELLNSKLTLWKYQLENQLIQKAQILEKRPETLGKKMILKSHRGFSGSGNYLTLPKSDNGAPFLLMPHYQRERDYSYVHTPEYCFIVKTIIDQHFQFKGVTKATGISEELSSKINTLVKRYQQDLKLDSQAYWSIDFFTYRKEGEVVLFPGCEINYRRTMSMIYEKLDCLFDSKMNSYLILTNDKKLIKQTAQLSIESTRGQFTALHPENAVIGSFYFNGLEDSESADIVALIHSQKSDKIEDKLVEYYNGTRKQCME